MKHFKEIICVKSGVVSAEYSDELFNVKKDDIFAVVGSNNGTQMCIEGEYDETTICLLHDGKYTIGTLKSADYNCNDFATSDDFAEFDYIN